MSPADREQLAGSEKQVAWAEKIRSSKLEQWANRVARAERSATDQPGLKADPLEQLWLAAERPLLQAWLDENVFGQTEAKWWIDHREENFIQTASLALRAELRAARSALRGAL